MTRRLRLAASHLALTSWAVLAQEVKLNEHPDPQFLPPYVGNVRFGPQGPGAVWGSYGVFCGGQGAGVHRFQRLRGTFGTPETQSFSCNSSGGSDLAVLPSGELIVAGAGPDGGSSGVMVRLFDPSLNPMGTEFLVNQVTTGDQAYGRVAALASDRFAVVWGDDPYLGGVAKRVAGRIVMADGSLPDPEVTVAPALPPAFGDAYGWPRIAASGTQFTVIWSYQNAPNNNGELRSRTFDESFAPSGPEIILAPTQPGFAVIIGLYDIAGSGAGYVACWHRQELTGANPKVLGRILDANGAPTTPEFFVEDFATPYSYYTNPSCAMDASGRSIVTWNGDGTQGFTVYAKRLDSLGNPIEAKFRVPMGSPDPQTWPAIATRSNGDFVIAWRAEWLQGVNVHADLVERRYSFPVSLAVAPGPGGTNPPSIRTLRPDGRIGWPLFQAYGAGGFGANVGTGDIDGDSFAEVLAGPGPSGSYGPQVRAFRPDGTAIQKVNFYAYGTLRYGARVAGGSIDADAYGEILTAPGAGPVFGPHIRGWDFDNASLSAIQKISFFAYNTLKWGAQVSPGDIDGDGMREILTGPGPGVAFASQVRAFNFDGNRLTAIAKVNFNAFAAPRYGVTVATSDVESNGIGGYGDAYQEILAGVAFDPAFTAQVRLFNYDNASVAQIYEIAPYTSVYGANVAGGDIDAGDTEEVVTAPGPDPAAQAHVIAWEWDPVIGVNPDGPQLYPLGPDDFTIFTGMGYGANVAVGTFE